jgi:type I restriction enzyme S subunit
MKCQPYTEYKESGVQWLGKVPVHWEVTKVKYYYDVQLGKMLQPEPSNDNYTEVKYLKAQHVQWNAIHVDDLPTMWASQKEVDKFAVQKGDLLICEGGEVGRSALLCELPEPCIIQNALHRVRPRAHSCVKYLKHVMCFVASAKWFDILCNRATIAHLTGEKLGSLEFVLPPLEEQQAIADFLDRKTAQIDELIAKKEELLGKLDEKRSALISRTVTRGLPADIAREFGLEPHTRFKDSGIEWLGEVPEGWEIWKIAHGFKYTGSGTTPPTDEDIWYDGDIRWLTTSELRENVVSDTSKNVSKGALSAFSALKVFPEGSLAIAMYGATIGRLGILGIPAATNQACCVMGGDVALNSYFMFYWFQAFREKVVLLSSGGGQPNISQEKIRSLRVASPELPEQKAIAAYLDRETSKIDQLRERVSSAVERLREYRAALISDAVTGQRLLTANPSH